MEIAPCALDVSFRYPNSTVQVSSACLVVFLAFATHKRNPEGILTFQSVLKVYPRGQKVSWWMINLTFCTYA